MNVEQRLEKAKQKAVRSYGHRYVNYGDTHYRLVVARTPCLMLDYKLGIGGVPYGHGTEIFGANQLGKSALGYSILGQVQRDGKLPALLAVEPRLQTPEDCEWARRLGLEPDAMLIQYPDTAEMAFEMLRELVFDQEPPDFIMIDSIGGMGSESSAKSDGTKKAYGISGTVTDGLNAVMPRASKSDIGILLINQHRQKPSSRPGLMIYESPGGEGLKHHMRIRIQLKPGRQRYVVKHEGDDLMVGRELKAVIVKNNMSQGANKTATFDFFHIETELYGFGWDKTADLIATGKITGVIEGTTWLSHHTWGKLQGKAAVREYIDKHPDAYEAIRGEIMEVMYKEELAAAKDVAAKGDDVYTSNVEIEEDDE